MHNTLKLTHTKSATNQPSSRASSPERRALPGTAGQTRPRTASPGPRRALPRSPWGSALRRPKHYNDRNCRKRVLDRLGETDSIAMWRLNVAHDQSHAAAKLVYNLEPPHAVFDRL
jgi:hypothetical protein